jgi:benzodiazapine receptor
MKNKSIFSLILWYIPALFVQYFAATATMKSLDPWYTELVKASWNPPPWVFGPVWTLLYLMMSLSVWTIYRTDAPRRKKWGAYALYFAQLGVNGLWSFLFFKWKLLGGSAVEIFLIIAIVLWMTVHYFKINKTAGWLLIPYLGWLIYASTLNVAIWVLN